MPNQRAVSTVAAAIALLLALSASARAADPQGGQVRMLGDFETDVDGFSGAFERHATGGKVGKAYITLTNTKDGWIDGGKDLDLEEDITELRLWVKSTTASAIAVRLTDKAGQSFQHRLELAKSPDWQQLTITDPAASQQSWGGANDKKWRGPAGHIQLILEGGHNDIAIDGIEATLGAHIYPPFKVASTHLGNIFLGDEEVALPIETSGDQVAWKAFDYHHQQLAEGSEKVVDGRAIIKPGTRINGYYTMSVLSTKGGQTVADKYTSYAIIPALAAGAPGDSPFGAMTHFAQGWDTDVPPLLAELGVGAIRDEQYWEALEKTKGTYSYPASFEAYMAKAKTAGVAPLVAMTFGNKNYDGGNAPATPEGREAYANYGVELLKHYGKQIQWLEIWNEYNGSWCGGEAEKDRPKYYAEMIKVAYPKLKAARPDVTVLGCGAVLMPVPYLEGIFKNGGLQAMDAIAVHPYRGQPEGVEVELAETAALIRKYNDGKDKPIWVTETGCMPQAAEYDWEKGKEMWELARANTTRYLTRQYTLLLSVGTVDKIFWYLTRDYNEFKLMGLLRDPNDGAGR